MFNKKAFIKSILIRTFIQNIQINFRNLLSATKEKYQQIQVYIFFNLFCNKFPSV